MQSQRRRLGRLRRRQHERGSSRGSPFCDFGAVTDPPSADVTAHVRRDAGARGPRRIDPDARRGIDWLLREQERDGSWFGRWGANYVYGTGAVLPALAALRPRASTRAIARAVAWLERVQNADGGFGRGPALLPRPRPGAAAASRRVADRVGAARPARGRRATASRPSRRASTGSSRRSGPTAAGTSRTSRAPASRATSTSTTTSTGTCSR